jgi:hypothetical protein
MPPIGARGPEGQGEGQDDGQDDGQGKHEAAHAETAPARAGPLNVATPNNALEPPPRPRALWVAFDAVTGFDAAPGKLPRKGSFPPVMAAALCCTLAKSRDAI